MGSKAATTFDVEADFDDVITVHDVTGREVTIKLHYYGSRLIGTYSARCGDERITEHYDGSIMNRSKVRELFYQRLEKYFVRNNLILK